MAKLNYIYRGKNDTGNLSIRFTSGTDIDYRISTPIKSKKEYWKYTTNNKDGKRVLKHRQLKDISIQNKGAELKNHKTLLENIDAEILGLFIIDNNNGVAITKDWLKDAIAKSVNILDTKEKIQIADAEIKQKETAEQELKDKIYNANLLSNAIKKMFVKYETNRNELKKYKVTLNRFTEYEKSKKEVFKIIDLNQQFADEFMNWSYLDMKYSKSYTNAQLKKLRYSAVNAYENDENDIIKVSKKLKTFKMFSKVYKDKIVISLNYDEIDKIDNTNVDSHLLDAKKALLIGCETGLRYSDMNKLIDTNIKNIDGVNYWKFRTEKTNAIVQITISKRIIYLLEKYGLPQTNYPSNGVKLNEDIKQVCKDSKIDELVNGSKATIKEINNENATRNVVGLHKKYKLITTRTFRRSFATNYYGKIDTALITAITGHASETQLRAYINNKDESNIKRTKKQIDKFHKKRKQKKNDIKLTVIPKVI
jgi:hypothetical protein